MDWNPKTALEWDWENLAGISAKAIDNPKLMKPANRVIERDGGVDNRSVYSCGGAGFSGSDLGQGSSSRSSMSASVDSSLKEGMMIYKTVNGFPEDFSEKKGLTRVDSTAKFSPFGGSTSFDEPIIGLKLGKRTYFEDVCVVSDAKTSSLSTIPTASAATTKRSRVSYQSTQTPRCQVEGCNLDLKSAKDYHRRHRICESHSKSPKVIVAGMERRFCQQCSRFHELVEFDDKKRSCRRRLSDHNARRRRPQPEAIQFNSTRLSSSLYDRRQQMNLVFNKVPFPAASSTWQSACSFKVTQDGDSLIGTAKAGGIGTQINISTNEMPDSTSMLQIDSDKVLSFEGSTPRVFSQGLEAATYASNFDVAPDLRRALSLLSTNSWGLNGPEPTSLNELMHVNQSSMAQPVMHAELQNWALALSEHERVEALPPGSRAHTLDLHNNGGIHFQEFQLVKGPFESGWFYSNQIN